MMARRSAGLLLVVQLFVIKKLGVHKSFSVTCRGPGFEKEGAVNFGLLMSFRNSSRNELSFSELYRRHVDLCVEAEDLGFDTIWLTEHHFAEHVALGSRHRRPDQAHPDRHLRTTVAFTQPVARSRRRRDYRCALQRAF